MEIFIGSRICCVALIVNQELILKRVHSVVIVNLNAEFIYSLLKDIFGQKKKKGAFFNKYKYFLIFFVLICYKKWL